jgi:NAD(P)-dependent dehydrogenase (short-subunit alcohol dehydrogenase family)
VVGVARRIELMEAMADEVEAAQHPRPILVQQDVMEEDAAAKIAAAANNAVGRIDILVNNAGGSRRLPVDAPEGAAARPITPDSSKTSASTVGLPRESRISLAITSTIALMLFPYAGLLIIVDFRIKF